MDRTTPSPLRIAAAYFGSLAVLNLFRPLLLGPENGFVFLDARLAGAANLIASWSFAVFLAWYAAVLWREQRVALALGIAYAGYVSMDLHYTVVARMNNFVIPGQAPVQVTAASIAALIIAWGTVLLAAVKTPAAESQRPPGRILLRSFALLFALLALSNALKPFVFAPDVGLVFFGHRLTGAANLIGGPLFAVMLAIYAVSIWSERRRALPMAIAYALYVPLNIALWNGNNPSEGDMPLPLALLYILSAVGVSSGAAILLWNERARLK